MSANIISQKYSDIVTLAEDAADGAKTHEDAIGLKQNTEVVIRADLFSLTASEAAEGLRG
ncbi:MAG: hypothetical protein H8M99_09670 [Gloeobacteraceae cyanobacterium ES-bin-144]|nr:hypothetical protein [Verrucomicrobiales bacterium]